MWYQQEHDACGIGSIVNIDGRKDHKVLDDALHIVEKLEHRAGKDATGEENPVKPGSAAWYRRKKATTASACFSCRRIPCGGPLQSGCSR